WTHPCVRIGWHSCCSRAGPTLPNGAPGSSPAEADNPKEEVTMERLVERPNDDGGPLFPAPHEEMTAKKGVRRGARLLAAGLLALLMVGARLPVIGVGDAHAAGYWTSGNCFYAQYATGSGYFKVGCLQNYNGTRYFLGLPPVYGS